MILIVSVLLGMTLGFADAKPADPGIKYYASKYDHIDVEAILNNRRMVNYYSACLLGGGPCPPEGVEFKRILPEALRTNCGRCTEKQATVAFRAIKRIKKEYPKIWNQLSEKWDPDDIYVKKFESTFSLRNGATKPTIPEPVILNRFGGQANSETTDNNILGSFSPDSATSNQDPTTNRVITSTSTNSIPSSYTTSTISTKTTDYPYPSYELTSLVSTTKTSTTTSSPTSTPNALPSISTTAKFRPSITNPSTSSSTLMSRFTTTTSSPGTTEYTIRTSTRSQVIPNLIPLNTFFTNPPVRPFINLNIGANIGATVSGLVRGFGALGTRFMETGADIAEIVIKNFARPLQV